MTSSAEVERPPTLRIERIGGGYRAAPSAMCRIVWQASRTRFVQSDARPTHAAR
jgi:hypothetical protein